MKILLAPDSFKGSMTAHQAALAMKKGIVNSGIETNITMIPMADGGEGTMLSMVNATDVSTREKMVKDSLGRNRKAKYGITGDGKTAIIELASASGLNTVAVHELNPSLASTYGTGQLIVDALDKGLRDFLICLGGSATNDGGVGLLSALGYRFINQSGEELKPGGLALGELNDIDCKGVDKRIAESTFRVACDVKNPLIGPKGASFVFGPQKGASGELVKQLDQALEVYADCIEREMGISVHGLSGAGAAGGSAAGLVAFLNAELRSGIELVMEALHLDEKLKDQQYDLLISGEGKLDAQTVSGKVVAGLAETAKRYELPVVAVCGAVEGDLSVLHDKGLTAAFSISQGPGQLQEALENAEEWLAKTVEQLFRMINVKFKMR